MSRNNFRTGKALFVLVLVYFLLSCTDAFAHPGGLDKKGGHYDKNTGKYHYHNKSKDSKEDNDKMTEDDMKTDLEAIDNIRDIKKEENTDKEESNNDISDNNNKSITVDSSFLKIGIGIGALLMIGGFFIYYIKKK